MMESPADEQVRAGQIARGAIALARNMCEKRLDGLSLDKEIEQYIRDEGGTPALKGYHPSFASKPYEWTICLGVDEDAVHGVPIKVVEPNMLITVDLVVEFGGWYADTARTFTLTDDVDKHWFARNSWDIFKASLDAIMPEQSINLYGMAVQSAAHIYGYSVVNEYCGHGIGRAIHTLPQVCNSPVQTKDVFQVGQSYAVEPILAINSTYSLRHEPDDGFSV
ncbi:MAG: methionyl aminopeptidase, partial [Nitrososphaerales archaeon]